MNAVAFLQNQWFNNPARVQALIDSQGERYRDAITRYALFAGCLSGHRIKAAFGDLIDGIVWANVSPVLTAKASDCPPASPDHIRSVLERHEATVVLAFGKVAEEALRPIIRLPLIVGPHPASRQADIAGALSRMAQEFKQYAQNQRQPD